MSDTQSRNLPSEDKQLSCDRSNLLILLYLHTIMTSVLTIYHSIDPKQSGFVNKNLWTIDTLQESLDILLFYFRDLFPQDRNIAPMCT